jgi:hypothetical protein
MRENSIFMAGMPVSALAFGLILTGGGGLKRSINCGIK